MAINVCYATDGGPPDWSHPVIYLDQSFYESAHALIDDKRAGPILLRILTMGYGGNVMIFPSLFQELLVELDELEYAIGALAQMNDLRSAIETAQQRKKALVFGGDMYPELDKQLWHKLKVSNCKKCGSQHKSRFWDVCDECGHLRNPPDRL